MTTALTIAGFALRCLAALICISAILILLMLLAELAIAAGLAKSRAAYLMAGYFAYAPTHAVIKLARIA